MSLFGPGIMQTNPDSQGEVAVASTGPDARFTLPAKDGEEGGIWLPEEYPNQVYDTAGRKIDMEPMTKANHTLKSGGERSWY